MPSRSVYTLYTAILLLGIPATRAHGQIAGASSCSTSVYDDDVPTDGADAVGRMHPLISRARYADAVRNGEWALALRGLRDDAMQAFVAAEVAPTDQELFFGQLDSVLTAVGRLPAVASDQRTRYIVDSIKPARFRPRPATTEYEMFRGAQTIRLGAIAPQQVKALCWSAMSVDLVLFRLSTPLEMEALARLARLNTAWGNYRTYGYTRQPLELWLLPGSVHDTLPSRGQWLIGHLSVGAEIRGRLRDSLTSNTATVAEVGHLWYWRNYTQYSGLSGMIAAAPGHTIGYGAMLHIARSLRGGIVFERNHRATTRSLILSTDLYGLLDRSKRSVDQGLALARGAVVLPQAVK